MEGAYIKGRLYKEILMYRIILVGVDKNVQKAVELYQETVKQKNVTAYTSLGLCYKNGIGVERNIQKAIILFQKAAEKTCTWTI